MEKNMSYLALIHRTGANHFGVSFPDFPDCRTIAPTLSEAILKTHQTLRQHVKSHLQILPDKTSF